VDQRGGFMGRKDIANSVLKAASILTIFTPNELEFSVPQISKKVGMPKTTTRRMVASLVKAGLLEQIERTGMFRIGPALFMQGMLYLRTLDMLREIRAVSSTLSELTGETITSAVFDKEKLHVMFILVEDSIYRLRWDLKVGTIVPAHVSTVGRSFLSELDDAEIDRLYPEEKLPPGTKTSITKKSELYQEIAKIRQTGVAFDIGQYAEGLEGVASLVRNASGKAVAGMIIVAPTIRMNETKRAIHGELIKLGVGLVSYRLGYHDLSIKIHSLEELRTWWQQIDAVPAAT